MEIERLERLLQQTQSLLVTQEEIRKLRGESFNIFSILKMESQENVTHSALLANLLSRKGSHGMKTKFLELFLAQLPNHPFKQLEAVEVKTEFHLGTKNLEAGTGGRVDIYLHDQQGKSFCIENKIHADDQPKQIERYCSHNSQSNTVYYLTLYGTSPSEGSAVERRAGEDFHLLSYRTDIINWLQACHTEASDWPILRETIKQYIILLKKLTGTMDKTEGRVLESLMLDHFEAASYIASNFERTK